MESILFRVSRYSGYLQILPCWSSPCIEVEKLGVTYGLQDPNLDQQPATLEDAPAANQDESYQPAAALSSPPPQHLDDNNDNVA